MPYAANVCMQVLNLEIIAMPDGARAIRQTLARRRDHGCDRFERMSTPILPHDTFGFNLGERTISAQDLKRCHRFDENFHRNRKIGVSADSQLARLATLAPRQPFHCRSAKQLLRNQGALDQDRWRSRRQGLCCRNEFRCCLESSALENSLREQVSSQE